MKFIFLKKKKGLIGNYFHFNQDKFGFTLIELMVVLVIMGLLFSVFLTNINGLRGKRNLKLAQSQLVSNLRKMQSYTLSSRNILNNVSVQYYVAKFDVTSANQYSIYAIYDIPSSTGKLKKIETIKFPENVKIQSVSIDLPAPYVDQNNSGCSLVSFKTPFAKILTNGSSFCNPVNPADPYVLTPTDDFSKITLFYGNGGTAASDAIMTITLIEQQTNTTKWAKINAINGIIDFEQ